VKCVGPFPTFKEIKHVICFLYYVSFVSSHFGYFDENEEVVEMRDRKTYVLDTFGLKTLDKKKRLTLIKLNGVPHHKWHTNKTVIDKYIISFLK